MVPYGAERNHAALDADSERRLVAALAGPTSRGRPMQESMPVTIDEHALRRVAELAGPTGAVTTIDIDPEVSDRARHVLSTAGYPQVKVVTGDGAGRACPVRRARARRR